MQTLKYALAAIVVATGLLPLNPVKAMEEDMIGQGDFTWPATCEDRQAQVATHISNKAQIHARLDAREDVFEAHAAEVIALAQAKEIDTSDLEAAVVTMQNLKANVDAAYLVMTTAWSEIDACSLSIEDFLAAISYDSPEATAFEAAGDAAGDYMTNVVRPMIKELDVQIMQSR